MDPYFYGYKGLSSELPKLNYHPSHSEIYTDDYIPISKSNKISIQKFLSQKVPL